MQAVPYDPFAGPVLTLKKPQPKKVLAKAAPKTDVAGAEAKPTKTAAAKTDVVPSLRVAVDKY